MGRPSPFVLDGMSPGLFGRRAAFFSIALLLAGMAAVFPIAPRPVSAALTNRAAAAPVAAPPATGHFGGVGAGHFGNPLGIAVDQTTGHVFVADQDNRQVQEFGPTGSYLNAWFVPVNPLALAIANSTVYLVGVNGGSDTSNAFEYSESGSLVRSWNYAPSLIHVAVDPSGNVYAVEGSHGQVVKFASDGTVVNTNFTNIGGGGQAIATDASYLYFTTQAGAVEKFDFTGTLISQWTPAAGFGASQSIAIATNGNIYLSDYSNNRVNVYTNAGALISQFGALGQGDGKLYHPAQIALNSQGHAFLADSDNSRYQEFDAQGTFVRKVGDSALYSYYHSMGVASANGRVYVADTPTQGARISVFDEAGTLLARRQVTDILGPRGISIISQPASVAVNAAGDIYIDFSAVIPNVCGGMFLLEVDPQLNWLTGGGDGCVGNGFPAPSMTIDSLGFIYVNKGPSVQRFDPNLNLVATLAFPNASNGSVAVDSQGLVYFIGHETAHGIIDRSGNVVGVFSADLGDQLAIAPDRSWYQTSSVNSTLEAYPSTSTNAEVAWTLPYRPWGITVGSSRAWVQQNDDNLPGVGSQTTPATLFAYSSLSLASVMPPVGGNSGSVDLQLQGRGFVDGMGATLIRSGQPDISAQLISISPGGTLLTARFDLKGAALGPWTVRVALPDGSAASLPDGFTVEAGTGAHVWARIIGPGIIRPGISQRYEVDYGNAGNASGMVVPLTIAGIPLDAQVKLNFKIADSIVPEQGLMDDPNGFLIGVANTKEAALELALPLVAANSTGAISFEMTVPQAESFTLSTATCQPWMQSPVALNVIGCYGELYKFIAGFTPLSCFNSVIDASSTRILQASYHLEVMSLGEYALNAGLGCASSLAKPLLKLPGLKTLIQTPGPHETKLMLETIARDNKITEQALQFIINGTTTVYSISKDLVETQLSNSFFSCKELYRIAQERSLHVTGASSRDPNELNGPPGSGLPRYIQGGLPLSYQVDFENVPTATAPAQRIVIKDALPPQLDPSTVSLGAIVLAGHEYMPPMGSTRVEQLIDLRPDVNAIAQVKGNFDSVARSLTWTISTIDPASGGPPVDPLMGILPPDTSPPLGEGSVSFSASPLILPTGTTVTDSAFVTFDQNAPLATNTWTNTIDQTAPASRVTALQSTRTATQFPVSWSGTDADSGIHSYAVFMSDNGGPWKPWLVDQTASSATFTGETGHSYGFFSQAFDNAGNLEPPHSTADTTTTVLSPVARPTVTSVSPPSGSSAGGTQVTITGTGFTSDSTVKFGDAAATSVTVGADGTRITATSPSGTGTVDVTVTTPGGTSATSSNSKFTYVSRPTLTSLSPPSGPGAGGTQVTITGSGFTSDSTVKFGDAAATNVTVGAVGTRITATSPSGTGTVDVTVTTPGGTSATSSNSRFTYTAATVTQLAETGGGSLGLRPIVQALLGALAFLIGMVALIRSRVLVRGRGS